MFLCLLNFFVFHFVLLLVCCGLGQSIRPLVNVHYLRWRDKIAPHRTGGRFVLFFAVFLCHCVTSFISGIVPIIGQLTIIRLICTKPVSYTHLTLPTIYSV